MERSLPKVSAGLASRRSGPVQFVREVISELRKVTWPTRDETIKLTAVVIVLSALVGAFIGGLDSLFVKLTSIFLKK